jgi:hypothetical protein
MVASKPVMAPAAVSRASGWPGRRRDDPTIHGVFCPFLVICRKTFM